MKTYEKNGLKYAYILDKNGKDAILFVTADSIYKKLGLKHENKNRWIKENLLKKYSDNTYMNDFNLGYCIDVQIAEDMLYTTQAKNQQKYKAIGDLISTEEDEFYMKDKWKEDGFGEGENTFYTTKNWVEEDSDDTFYKENLQPKVTSALESITKTAETPFIDSEELRKKWANTKIINEDICVQLPDRLLINGKEYISEEKYQKDTVTLQIKMDALKSVLEQ